MFDIDGRRIGVFGLSSSAAGGETAGGCGEVLRLLGKWMLLRPSDALEGKRNIDCGRERPLAFADDELGLVASPGETTFDLSLAASNEDIEP
jgi:hypothetical protein